MGWPHARGHPGRESSRSRPGKQRRSDHDQDSGPGPAGDQWARQEIHAIAAAVPTVPAAEQAALIRALALALLALGERQQSMQLMGDLAAGSPKTFASSSTRSTWPRSWVILPLSPRSSIGFETSRERKRPPGGLPMRSIALDKPRR